MKNNFKNSKKNEKKESEEKLIDLNKYIDFSTFSSNKGKNSSFLNSSNTINSFLESSMDIIKMNFNDQILSKNEFINTINSEEFTSEFREKLKIRRIETIKNELNGIKINFEFLKKTFKLINFSNTKHNKNKHLENLFEIQNIEADSKQIWIAKLREDGKYLATAGKSGILKIWEIISLDESLEDYENNGINNFFKFIKDYPFRIYKEHTDDIIDICWSLKVLFFF